MPQRRTDSNMPKRRSDIPDNRHPRTEHKGRGMLYVMLALTVLLIIFMVALWPFVMTDAPQDATIRIPRNATEKNVHDSLTKYYGDSYASYVMKLARLRRTDFSKRHGAYRINHGDNAISAMRRLTSGAQTPVKFTLNGYRSLSEMIQRISARFDFTPDSLRTALYDTKFLSTYGLNANNAMALFVNDTYEAYWSSSPQQVLDKLGDNYALLWNDQNKAKASDLGLKPEEIMILASIVDEETNAVQEKGTVGRLYINRLHQGMRLQSDPTVRFALNDFTIRRVKGSDLKANSLYNTYMYAGLPPGPIRTVGKSTVSEILDSKPNNYLYMCAKEDFSGTHNFATDYDEHMRNAKRYQQALDERGIVR